MERLEVNMKNNVTEEAYNHWHAVGAFFKCFAYARLVSVFGDVPYYERTFANNYLEAMYKDRDSRVFVMDKIHDLLKNEVLVNMRNDDGANTLNRYVAAAFASRWMLFEGTWQKYHGGDQAAAAKYLKGVMLAEGIHGGFGLGGITGYMVDMLNEGCFESLLDV